MQPEYIFMGPPKDSALAALRAGLAIDDWLCVREEGPVYGYRLMSPFDLLDLVPEVEKYDSPKAAMDSAALESSALFRKLGISGAEWHYAGELIVMEVNWSSEASGSQMGLNELQDALFAMTGFRCVATESPKNIVHAFTWTEHLR